MIDEKKLIEKIEQLQKIVFTYNFNVSRVCDNLLCEIKDFINEQPKVGEWIPVEERLPEQDKRLQDYLVRFEYYRYGEYNCMYKTIGIGTFDNLNHKFTFINGQTGWRDLNVLEWQPLPESYEVKEND